MHLVFPFRGLNIGAHHTALTLFQATLPAPIQVAPNTRAEREAAARGRIIFEQIRCSECHIPEMPLASPEFVESGPFNPENNLRPEDVSTTYRVDLSAYKEDMKKDDKGNFLIPAFTDLKRHDMGEFLDNEALVQGGIPTQFWLTRKLWGIASEPPYLHHGHATLISEAVLTHGGGAQKQRNAFANLEQAEQAELLEFLLTLRVDGGEK